MQYPIFSILIGGAAAFYTATVTARVLANKKFLPLPGHARIGCIDGLRGYLALAVMIHHFIIWMQITRLGGAWQQPTVHFFEEMGAGSVALFFMVSGFVFYPRVLSGFRASQWSVIYTNRAFRILPLTIFSVACVAVIISMRTGQSPFKLSVRDVVKWVATWSEPDLLGYPGSGRVNAYVLWSLWYEWLFYLFVLPACAFCIDLTRKRLPTWIVPVALLVVSFALRFAHLPSALPTYLPLFAIGMLAFECQSREAFKRAFSTPAAGILALALLAVGAVGLQTPYTFGLPLFGFFFVVVACGNDLGGVLKTRAALLLGECSYSIYLLHGIVLSVLFVDAVGLSSHLSSRSIPFLMPPVAGVLVLVTACTYRFVEQPWIGIGRRLANDLLVSRRAGDPDHAVAPATATSKLEQDDLSTNIQLKTHGERAIRRRTFAWGE